MRFMWAPLAHVLNLLVTSTATATVMVDGDDDDDDVYNNDNLRSFLRSLAICNRANVKR